MQQPRRIVITVGGLSGETRISFFELELFEEGYRDTVMSVTW